MLLRNSADFELRSPNGRVRLRFLLRRGRAFYELYWGEERAIALSRLGFLLSRQDEHMNLAEDFRLADVSFADFDEEWEAYWGEQRMMRDHCREMCLTLHSTTDLALKLYFRAYDEGAAFRYEIMGEGEVEVLDELSEFNFAPEARSWSIPAFLPDRYEYDYDEHALFELDYVVHTPLTLQTPEGFFAAVHEAALYDYGGMTLQNIGGAFRANITPLSDGTKAHIALPFLSPWRMVMLGASELDLTTNRMMLNLNAPPTEDFSWVEPLKFLGIWWAMYVKEWTWAPGERHGATTEHMREYIDACAELQIPGLLAEGWNNGWEGDWLENGRYNNFCVPERDFDMPAVAEYARERGVALVGHHETVGFVDNYEAQLEDAYKYYAEHGLRYIKSGYAGPKMWINGRQEYHHSQAGVRHYQRALELAARYGIMLNVHEPIKSTGIERTFPNLLTREGARGQEYESGVIRPNHACCLPFTRLLAGGMDYTPGILDVKNAVRPMCTTITRQIAFYLTIYSAMQMAADRPFIYERYPELVKFIAEVPLRWERTLPLEGKIGEYYVVAREDWGGGDWYIGGVTNEQAREVELSLDFLAEDAQYEAEIIQDGREAHYLENPEAFELTRATVRRDDALKLFMAPVGGFAVKLKRL